MTHPLSKAPQPLAAGPQTRSLQRAMARVALTTIGLTATLSAISLMPYVGQQHLPDPLPEPQPGSLRVGLDPETASAAQLEMLHGIGPARAQAIVRFRETRWTQQGTERSQRIFNRPEDLLAVEGIGPVTLERIRPQLRFDTNPPHNTP